jgi:hypothetical protein
MKRREFCKATLITGAIAAWPRTRFLAATPGAAGAEVPAVKLSGEPTVVSTAAVKDLAAGVRGQVLTANDAGYDAARRLWNAMIDRRPAVIVRCTGAADVARTIGFAREHQLLVAVKGGGHSFPGHSMCNGGLVIDLSGLHSVRVDPASRTARCAGGAWIGDLDWEAQHFGLATPMGEISHTGVAGLTLGGGYGWLARRFGLACDNLISADLVTADAKFHRVSAQEHPDLFWALRGGGGNFGVVTSFEYRLHPVGPKVLAGSITYPETHTRAAFETYAGLVADAPREFHSDFGWEVGEDGVARVTLYTCYSGDPKEGEKIYESLRRVAKPVADTVSMQDYVILQRQFDGPPLSEMNNYLKSGFVREITPELIGFMLDNVRPQPFYGIYFLQCGGAIADVDPTATAVAHRKELVLLGIEGHWPNAADNERNRGQLRAEWDKVSRFTQGFYVNLNETDQKATEDNYGPNRARLMALKKQYDPVNLFRLNANVLPAA